MRKRDVLTPLGITIGFIMIMLAILSNGGREGIDNFIDIASIFIVIGGLIGSLLINFKYEQIKLFNSVMKEAFRKNDYDLKEMIHEIMDAEITDTQNRHEKGRAIIEKAGEYAPAWGMIGTLIGLVLMLSSLDDPASLGPNMAVALLTTLYGTILANLVFLPMASKLE